MDKSVKLSRSGFFARLLKPIVERRLDRLANKVADEIRQEIISGGYVNTGEALNSIYIEKGDLTRFIGSDSRHFKFLNDGNRGTDKFVRFKPKQFDSSKRKPNASGYVYSHGQKGFKGAHIIEKVASKHK